MFEDLFIYETFKRFNASELTIKDDKDLMKDLVKRITDMMDLIGIKNYKYIIRFDLISEYGNDPHYLVSIVRR